MKALIFTHVLRFFCTCIYFPCLLRPKHRNMEGSWTSLTCAVASTSVQFITNATFTSEKSRDILALSVDTDVSKGTFVYVCEKER